MIDSHLKNKYGFDMRVSQRHMARVAALLRTRFYGGSDVPCGQLGEANPHDTGEAYYFQEPLGSLP
jgi:hypothetical protein